MNSNFVKIGNDSDMNNDIEIEPKTRHNAAAREAGEKRIWRE